MTWSFWRSENMAEDDMEKQYGNQSQGEPNSDSWSQSYLHSAKRWE